MVPRSQIKYLDHDMSYDDILAYATDDQYSSTQFVMVILKAQLVSPLKDLTFIQNGAREKFKMDEHLKPQFFVYEHMKINAVFDHMNKRKP